MWLARSLFLIGLALLAAYYPKFGRYPLYDWFGFGAVMVAFGVSLARNRVPIWNHYTIMGGIFIFLGAALTVPNTIYPIHAAFAALLFVYVLAIWVPLPGAIFLEIRHLRAAFIALSISMVVSVSYALGQKALGWPHFDGEFGGRVTGLTRHPNELGRFCAMVVPYLLCLSATAKGGHRRMGWIGASILAFIGVLITGSRTGVVVLGVALVVYFALADSRYRLRIVSFTMIGVLAAFGFQSIHSISASNSAINRFGNFLESHAGRHTLDIRLGADMKAISYIEAHPLEGHGYKSRVQDFDIVVHNTFLAAWYDGGLFSVLGVITVIVGAIAGVFNGWNILRRSSDPPARLYASAVTAALAATIVAMQGSAILYDRSAWFPVALAYAFSVVARHTVRVQALGEGVGVA